jgi:NAD(P)-dependent dehydrogenase (short-subunit alcohol dehydrogenase family)
MHAMSSNRVSPRVVVITGAAGGIGSALARRFAAAGDHLALLDLDQTGVEALAASLVRPDRRVIGIRCDVTSFDDCRAAIDRTVAELGGIDVLVNNAGRSHISLFAQTSVEVLRKVMEINFFGALHCTKAALPALVARRGVIVVLSSVAGFAPLAGRVGYAASKHALHGLFESLRAEVAPDGVHVMMVCPGFTDTGIGRNALGGDGGKPADERTTTGTPATPESVAGAIFAGVARRRGLLLLGPVSKVSWWVSHLFPRLYERLMVKQLLEPQREGQNR